MDAPKFPTRKQRTILVGRTGTGKTVAGLWHLSHFEFEKPDGQPWIIVDFKNDEHVNSIPNLQESDLSYIPTKKDDGIFIVHPTPLDAKGSIKQASPLHEFFTKIWERENLGIFVDEAFVIGQNDGFDLCLTQGRSKRIPIIMCTQRPVWVSRFAFSEADFIQVFSLNDDRDKQTVEGFTPIDFNDTDKLPEHCSYYYEVARDRIFRFNPVPSPDEILETFDAKLRRRVTRI